MEKFILFWSKVQKNGEKIIAIAVIAIFAAMTILFAIESDKLKGDINVAESEIAYLNEKQVEYQTALESHEELIKKVTNLEDDIDVLENNNDSLEDEITTLAEEKDELERQNGEMLKKFDGLSKPQ